MNILILGDGPDELAWAYAVLEHPEHRLAATCPGFKSLPDIPAVNDLDAALAFPGLDAVICGGDPALRAEGLRRAASTGMRALALHPPGPNADPYYQVALSRQENGAIVVPDLPGRLHPGMALLGKAIPGAITVRYDVSVEPADGDLRDRVFARLVDAVRALIGDARAITATGIPTNDRAIDGLTIQFRADADRHAEMRLAVGPREPARLMVVTSQGSVTLEHDIDFHTPARVVRKLSSGAEEITELGAWDAKAAILRVLDEATAERDPTPGLLDGTRAMELTEAVARSLRRGRTIDLEYEEMSEVGNFKSVMTSVGCGLLLSTIGILFLAAAGKFMGYDWAVYLVWIVPPLLVAFALFQLLRYGIKQPELREPPTGASASAANGNESPS